MAPAVGQPSGGRTSVTGGASGSKRVYASMRSTDVTANRAQGHAGVGVGLGVGVGVGLGVGQKPL